MEIVRTFEERDQLKIPIIYSNYLNRNVIREMEKVRVHARNYITLFVRRLKTGEYRPYFASCQTDEQIRRIIATGEKDSAMSGYAGSVPLGKDEKISMIFLNNRGGEFAKDEYEKTVRSVVSGIDPFLFLGSSVEVIFDRQERYMFDPETSRLFKVLK